MSEQTKAIGLKLRNASLAATVICIGLIIVSKHAQTEGDLLRSWALMFTSNLVMLVYLFGLRRYVKVLAKPEAKKDKDATKN